MHPTMLCEVHELLDLYHKSDHSFVKILKCTLYEEMESWNRDEWEVHIYMLKIVLYFRLK
jgi:hypothetical protein